MSGQPVWLRGRSRPAFCKHGAAVPWLLAGISSKTVMTTAAATAATKKHCSPFPVWLLPLSAKLHFVQVGWLWSRLQQLCGHPPPVPRLLAEAPRR